MCGICCIMGCETHSIVNSQKYVEENSRLSGRGPDCLGRLDLAVPDNNRVVFMGSVLSLRGQLTPQPLKDDIGNILLWNGEIFGGIEVRAGYNDSSVLLKALGDCKSEVEILTTLASIRGPYSFIYWQADMKRLWWGRDVLGRRSLLWHIPETPADVFVLSSVQIKPLVFEEIPAVGIFHMDLSGECGTKGSQVYLFPWQPDISEKSSMNLSDDKKNSLSSKLSEKVSVFLMKTLSCSLGDHSIRSPLSTVNMALPGRRLLPDLGDLKPVDYLRELLDTNSQLEILTSQLINVLKTAVERRVNNVPRKTVKDGKLHTCHNSRKRSRSGETTEADSPDDLGYGDVVDPDVTCSNTCAEESFPASIAILFSGGLDSTVLAALVDKCIQENETIDLLNVAFEQKHKQQPRNGGIRSEDVFNVPDRQTGLTALSELNPNRNWNFIEVNVTVDELRHYREACISELLYPLNTVLDDSIGCAIWFAARGKGKVKSGRDYLPYTSTARVILVGMGADEQLAGYSRHRGKFQAEGWKGLTEEIQMEVNRISTRNLGRDDRVIADHGKESRMPFLDEDVVCFLNQLPINMKADLNLARGIGEKLLLRLCAVHLGLPHTATAPKRAIQFGSRIAKSENRKETASDVCDRLKRPSEQVT